MNRPIIVIVSAVLLVAGIGKQRHLSVRFVQLIVGGSRSVRHCQPRPCRHELSGSTHLWSILRLAGRSIPLILTLVQRVFDGGHWFQSLVRTVIVWNFIV